MKKSFLTILLLLNLFLPVSALTLQASVEYTVDSARVEAFTNIQNKIKKSEFLNDKKDPLYYNNTLMCIRAGITYDKYQRPRKIVPFYEKNGDLSFYGVQYNNAPTKKYYYSSKGILLKYEVNNFNGTYPYKTIAYDTNGNLLNINLVISPRESYLFDKNKKLLGHWLNEQFYDENGNKDITRHF